MNSYSNQTNELPVRQFQHHDACVGKHWWAVTWLQLEWREHSTSLWVARTCLLQMFWDKRCFVI